MSSEFLMLPRLPNVLSKGTSENSVGMPDTQYEIIEPPYLEAKGLLALQSLKIYAENVYEKYKGGEYLTGLVQHCSSKDLKIKDLNQQIINYQADLKSKISVISELKAVHSHVSRNSRSSIEMERLLVVEKNSRIQSQNQILDLEKQLKQAADKCAELEKIASKHISEQKLAEAKCLELEQIINAKNQKLQELGYALNELQVKSIKLNQDNESLEAKNSDLYQKNEMLMESSEVIKKENSLLQGRIKELIEANKEVTSNYQIVKKNFDLKKHESEELLLELEEAKAACHLSIKQKKAIQSELDTSKEARKILQDSLYEAKETIQAREESISDLLRKQSEIISTYEDQLTRKDQQLWNMNEQLTEETIKLEKQRQAASAEMRKRREESASASHTANKPQDITSEVVTDIEKKWQKREKALIKEIESAENKLIEQEHWNTNLKSKIIELEKDLYHPRMKNLHILEENMKQKLLELSLSEENIEAGFLCPRDLKILDSPTTLVPCGHTYCACCVEDMREEGFNVIHCIVCNSVPEGIYKNIQLEKIVVQFVKRQGITKEFLKWIKSLNKPKMEK